MLSLYFVLRNNCYNHWSLLNPSKKSILVFELFILAIIIIILLMLYEYGLQSGDKAYVLCFVEFNDSKCALTAMEALQGAFFLFR